MVKDLEERLDYIEYRQELLFDNGPFSRLMFEYEVTRDQYNALIDFFSSYRKLIDNGESLDSSIYEARIGEIVPHHKHDYHFAEFVAQVLHEEGQFKEVFEELYGDAPKFKSYLDTYKTQNK